VQELVEYNETIYPLREASCLDLSPQHASLQWMSQSKYIVSSLGGSPCPNTCTLEIQAPHRP